MAQGSSSLYRALRAYQIYGANTDVGKTIASTILCKGNLVHRPTENVSYLKAVSTGPLEEADDRHVARFSRDVKTRTLYQFDEPISPHLAAKSMAVKTSHC